MAINMNQIDFEEIRKRKDQVRGSQQAQERRQQAQRDSAQSDRQKREAETAKELQASKLMKELLGESLHANFVANKMAEWDDYRTHVSAYEIEKYLPVL